MAAVNYSNILKNVKAITKSKYSEYKAYFLFIYYDLVAWSFFFVCGYGAFSSDFMCLHFKTFRN